jgi:hypothetical protein
MAGQSRSYDATTNANKREKNQTTHALDGDDGAAAAALDGLRRARGVAVGGGPCARGLVRLVLRVLRRRVADGRKRNVELHLAGLERTAAAAHRVEQRPPQHFAALGQRGVRLHPHAVDHRVQRAELRRGSTGVSVPAQSLVQPKWRTCITRRCVAADCAV